MKIEVCLNYTVGSYNIIFNKYFNLPAAPFFGMNLYDDFNGNDITISLDKTNDFQSTEIGYFVAEKYYYAEIRYFHINSHWLRNQYNQLKKCGWKLVDKSDDLEMIISLLDNNK